jgi:pyridoxine kinase
MMSGAPRVLSIQSHVVSGYVGNKCVVFPLNRLGIECDAVNSVQFSNHTGYPRFAGRVLDGEGLWELVEGLEANGLLRYTHLLTGYIGSLSLLRTVARVAAKLREHNPQLVFGERGGRLPLAGAHAVCSPAAEL